MLGRKSSQRCFEMDFYVFEGQRGNGAHMYLDTVGDYYRATNTYGQFQYGLEAFRDRQCKTGVNKSGMGEGRNL